MNSPGWITMIAKAIDYIVSHTSAIGGFLVGAQLPAFFEACRQRIGGHLSEATRILRDYQEIAERFHDGNLQAYIRHHLQSSDPSFRAEGAFIVDAVDRVAYLEEASRLLAGNFWDQISFVLEGSSIVVEAWREFDLGFTFTSDTMLFGVVSAVLANAVFRSVVYLAGASTRAVFHRGRI